MKAPLFVSSLLLAAATTIGTAQAAQTGSLRITGEIQGGGTCHLDATDVNRTIRLPPIRIIDLGGIVIEPGLWQFNLTANCDPDIRNVTFTFNGTPAPGSPTHFANEGGTSSGVVTVLQSYIGGTNSLIPANGNPADRGRTIPTNAGKAVLSMKAHYAKIPLVIVNKGTLITLASVTITYN